MSVVWRVHLLCVQKIPIQGRATLGVAFLAPEMVLHVILLLFEYDERFTRNVKVKGVASANRIIAY